MAHIATKSKTLKFRLTAKDLASIRKLARNAQVTTSEMIRVLIRRARVAHIEVQP